MSNPSPLRISETFVSLQGEGPSLGQPSFFLRLAHCNLRCSWCDTKYSWDFDNYDYSKEVQVCSPSELVSAFERSGVGRIVITGGEPLIQQAQLSTLLESLPDTVWVEVETNGTLKPIAAFACQVDQWNVSPKLANSGEPEQSRLKSEVLRVFRDTGCAWLKLVVGDCADVEEARQLIENLAWPHERVLLMPLAGTRAELQRVMPQVAQACTLHKLRMTPRLHLEIWGGTRAH